MFVDLVIQHVMRMRYVVICGLFDATFFSTLSHNRNDFLKSFVEHEMCVWLSVTFLSETFLSLRRIGEDMTKNVYLSSCKAPVILVWFEWNLNFLGMFWKNTQMSTLIKIHPTAFELLLVVGQTDRHDEDSSRVLQFSNAPKA